MLIVLLSDGPSKLGAALRVDVDLRLAWAILPHLLFSSALFGANSPPVQAVLSLSRPVLRQCVVGPCACLLIHLSSACATGSAGHLERLPDHQSFRVAASRCEMETLVKRKLMQAIVEGSVSKLEAQMSDILLTELQAGSGFCRKALVQALDGSDFLNPQQRTELLHRYFSLSQPRGGGGGNVDAKCFIGILLCFHRTQEAEGLSREGAQFLLSAYHQKSNLAALLLALCYECGKGVHCSVESAVQCYSMAANVDYQLAEVLLKECVHDFHASAANLQQQQQQLPQMQVSSSSQGSK